MTRKKMGTYKTRAKKKWADRYTYSPSDPVRYDAFRMVLTDTDYSGYALEILGASEWIQNATIHAINEGAQGCSINLRELVKALGNNVDSDVAKIAATCSGYFPAPNAPESSVWFTVPFEGDPQPLRIPMDMLTQHYAGLVELYGEIAA